MKRLQLLIVIILPSLCLAQSVPNATLKLRKSSNEIHAFASIAGIIEGSITKETLLENSILELNSTKEGKIISFTTGFTSQGNYYEQRSKNENLHPKTLSFIENGDIKRIYFEKIYAVIENDTVKLNNIVLKIGKLNSLSIDPKYVGVTYFKSEKFNSISKSNPSEIRNIRGFYNKKTLQVNSYNISYSILSGSYTRNITNEKDIKLLISIIKNLPINTRLHINNVTFITGSKEINGTPISLRITH